MTIDVSKTWDFNPTGGSLLINAFGRCGVRPTELTAQHMFEGQLSMNFILTEMSNLQPNLWEVGLQTVPLLAGSASYTVPAETVTILDLYITFGTPSIDRYIYPISRTEYAAQPNKALQAFPTTYWFNRLVSPTITFWPVPDANNGPLVAKYYSVRQTMDVVLADGLNVEVPYRWLDAYVAGLAWKLSEIYAPAMEDKLFARYTRALGIASTQDTENVPLYIKPAIGGYFR